MPNAILTITCPDRKGIVAEISGFIAKNNGNIVSLEQFSDPVAKKFFMRIEWELAGFKLTPAQLQKSMIGLPGQKNLFFSNDKLRLAVFVSKYDHCLYDLLLRHRSGEINCDIPLIISNHPELEYVAKAFGIPFHCVTSEKKQLELLKKHSIDFVVLARYMQVVSEKFISLYPQKIINVHHSFLPAFKGAKPYHQAYEKGVKVIGATSHFVTPELDQGPIIQQRVEQISHKDTVDNLIIKGRDLERQVLADAVRLYIEHRLFVCGNRVIIL
jgi:formyltetrahydrofolate deformylase